MEPRGFAAAHHRRNDRLTPALRRKCLQKRRQRWLEDKIGTTLPCNVIVRYAGSSQAEVTAIDPVASMPAIDDDEMKRAAGTHKARKGQTRAPFMYHCHVLEHDETGMMAQFVTA